MRQAKNEGLAVLTSARSARELDAPVPHAPVPADVGEVPRARIKAG